MKKVVIASIVGGLLLFIWQTLSWTVLELHSPMQSYTPKQDEILKFLNENLDEGNYFLPTVPAGTSMEESDKAMTAAAGKPWADIRFHKAMNMQQNMGMNMIRGFLIDIIAVFLLCWFLLKNTSDFKTTLLSCVALGLISYLTTDYTFQIWYETKTIPNLIDAIAGWGLCGIWLGWWLSRK
ncbi:hypothetical protein EMA8858_00713 [Emticicia aquatica]|jgi:hypothetical protein|uniref:VanZ family protein n=1 Tax=Emticicia aquatica TaxID=1681835 RepID=A0ABN8EP32_9BACT|nr:hypothetical protein [Emticicia aquatica]CAH0994603.1 hypothetical protein EMA8858_00713 [Emticicia aquatica]